MRVAYINIEPQPAPTKTKLANDRAALRAGLIAWKLKHNARLEKQQQQFK